MFLDVKSAFPSVVVPVLIHDMWLRGVPEGYTRWFKRKLKGRSTTIAFDDFETELIEVVRGLDCSKKSRGDV
ncbi:hypothetical protein FA15DRAFT_596747 [Coprinopsis marcescibilis]|uniref:Reverse transcriptase domain-containing protein n=1 Tax=Coprinopsis marcescibilis TaxID=230819 RepID=A0A5C3KNQ0_COPMA|nr:hypothetical protein FA15DRAFT_596747 [Coprinopsis marcescibilis]